MAIDSELKRLALGCSICFFVCGLGLGLLIRPTPKPIPMPSGMEAAIIESQQQTIAHLEQVVNTLKQR